MEMHQVRYFLAVADTLNFTRAAEQCHVSQPALTRAIQQLEEETGRPPATARAQANPSDRFRPADRAAPAPACRRCRGGQVDGEAVSQPAAGADPAGDHVHGRAGAVHGISRRISRGKSGLRADPGRRRAEGPFRHAAGRTTRHCRDGPARAVQRAARCPAALQGALLHRLPDRPPAGAAEPRRSSTSPARPICDG